MPEGTWHTASLTHTYRPSPSRIPLKFLSGLVDSVVVHIDASALVTQTGAVSQVPGGQQAFLQEESEHVVAAAKSKNKSKVRALASHFSEKHIYSLNNILCKCLNESLCLRGWPGTRKRHSC